MEIRLEMRIAVLIGSPNKDGSSNLLAESFVGGAKEVGHSVQIIDAAHVNIHPCTGCIHCGYEGPCVQRDDIESVKSAILEADMLVFVAPLYYYGMSAQLKTLIDRCQRRFKIVIKRRRNFVVFRRGVGNKIKRFLAQKECSRSVASGA